MTSEIQQLDEPALSRWIREDAGRPLPVWEQVVFVLADEVEREDGVVVSLGRFRSRESLAPGSNFVLRPYGVHQRALILGVAPQQEGGVRLDWSRWKERA